MLTTGAARGRPPVEPKNGAPPKEKTPPSEATSQYPPVLVSLAVLTTGLFRTRSPIGGGRDAHHRLVQGVAAHRPVEAGVAEGEDTAVGGDLPVALAVRRRRHAHDRLVEMLAAHRPVEAGVAEGEDAAVGGDLPVPAGTRGHGDAHDGGVEVDVAGGAAEGGPAEGEDAPIGGGQFVTGAGRGRHRAGRDRPWGRSPCLL